MYDTRQRNSTRTWVSHLTEGWGPYTEHTYSVQGPSSYETVYSWRGKRRVKDAYGWIPPNDFELIKTSYRHDGGGKVTNKYYTYRFDFDQCYGLAYIKWPAIQPDAPILGPTDFGPEGLHALYQAQQEAWAEANGPDCPGLLWIGESRETLNWIRDIIHGVVKATVRLKSGLNALNGTKLRLADRTASLWLQYRYAVTPLALQLEEAMSLLSEKRRELKTVTGYVKRKERISKYRNYDSSDLFYIYLDTEEYLDFRGACKLYPVALRDNFDWGFKPIDALSTALELMKLSFVLNWFIDIAGFLAQYRPGDAEIAYQSNTRVMEIVKTVEIGATGHYGGPQWDCQYEPEKATYTQTWVKRDTAVEKTVLPAFNVEALTLVRKLDSVALAFQILKGLIPRSRKR